MKIGNLVLLILIWSYAAATWAQQPLKMNVMTFDGKSGYVELPQNLFDNLTEGTVETWVKWEKFEKWSRVFDFGRENQAVVVQTEKNMNSVNFRIWERKRKDHKIQAKKKLRQGVWHHIAAVFGRSGMAFYLDGELIGTDEFEGGLDAGAGGNNYIGKSNWPKDKLFRGEMAEFRVWNRRLSQLQIQRLKNRTLRGDEDGLVGYWQLGDAVGGEAPSGVEDGYAASVGGSASVASIPAISKFLVPGELAKTAQVVYDEATGAFATSDFERATTKFTEALDLVKGFKDAGARKDESQQAWDLAEATLAYADGERMASVGEHVRAYWAFDRALKRVLDFEDSASRRDQALGKATYSVGLFILSSSKIREALTADPGKGRSRKSMLRNDEATVLQQDHIYEILRENLEKDSPPYLKMVSRAKMQAMIFETGVNAALAHTGQVIDACKKAQIPVVIIGELTEAFTKKNERSEELNFWSTQIEKYTDSEGKKKKREVGKKSYRTHRYRISTEMGCLLNYQIINTATGEVIDSGSAEATDSDQVDYIPWNRYDGVRASDLRIREGSKYKKLSRDNRSAMDARSDYRSEGAMLQLGAKKIGTEMSEAFLDALMYYSPGK